MLVVKTGIRNGKRQEPKERGAPKNDINYNSNGSI